VHIGPIDFNHTQFFSRLRAPLAYWNALALFCVLAVPIALRAATDRRRLALPAAVLLLTTIGLTYSRGGVASLAVAVPVLLVAGLAASSRGVTGTISHGFDSFTSVKFERQNDPARILQTNSGNRWVWWSEAVGAWADKPLAGWGAGSFPLLHHRYRHNSLEVL